VQDAEEIAQDAFVRAYHALHRYPRERRASLALRPWLYRITLNLARNRARGLRHGLSYEDAASVLEQPVGTTKSDVHRGLRLLRDVLSKQMENAA
jgi:DNA-directed RNA polymerase specialized sigma24 family protein